MKTNLNVDTQGLREKILDLAMRGKLVEQDAGDEPASALLEKIRAEKAELVKEGKIKKSKKFPEITDDEKPFDIPDNWEWVRLGDIDEYMGRSINPQEYGKEKFELYSVPVFKKNYPEIIFGSEIRSSKQKVLSGDVLLCKINPRINRVWVVSNFTEFERIASSEWIVIRQPNIYATFLKYCLSAPYFRVAIQENVSGVGGSLTRAKPVIVKKIIIPLPPLAEQKRIADKVSELFKQVDVIEQNVAEYQGLEQAMRSKLLDLAMRGKLVEQDPNDEPASELLKQIQSEKAQLVKEGKIKKGKKLPEIIDDEKPFDIPDGWEWVRLGDVLIPEISKAPTEDFVYLDIASIDNKTNKIIAPKTINVLKEKVPSRARMVVEPKDILFSLVRPYLRNIAIVPESDSNLVASTGFYVIKPYKKVDFEYIFYTVLSNYVVSGLTKKYMKGDNSPSIKKGDLENYVIPLPPLAEQRRIADKVSKLFEQLDIINNNLVSAS